MDVNVVKVKQFKLVWTISAVLFLLRLPKKTEALSDFPSTGQIKQSLECVFRSWLNKELVAKSQQVGNDTGSLKIERKGDLPNNIEMSCYYRRNRE